MLRSHILQMMGLGFGSKSAVLKANHYASWPPGSTPEPQDPGPQSWGSVDSCTLLVLIQQEWCWLSSSFTGLPGGFLHGAPTISLFLLASLSAAGSASGPSHLLGEVQSPSPPLSSRPPLLLPLPASLLPSPPFFPSLSPFLDPPPSLLLPFLPWFGFTNKI